METCPICGERFDDERRLDRHVQADHGRKAPSADDVESLLRDVNFPKRKEEVVMYARQRTGDEEVLALLRAIPDVEYDDVADVMRAVEARQRAGDEEGAR